MVLYYSGKTLIEVIKFQYYSNDNFYVYTLDEDKKLSKNPNYINAINAFDRKEYNVAIDELNEEIQKYPKHAQAFFLLGKIYEEEKFPEGKYYQKMINNYEQYIKLKPKGKRIDYVKLKVAQYYVQVGLTQQRMDLLNTAEEYLKSLDQNNGDVKMALGAIYLNNQDYKQAIMAFEKSANLAPSELKLKYNSLGLAHIKVKQYAKAERILEIAVKIDSKDKYAHNNLGFVYAQQGKLNNAKVHFEEALKLDPDYKNAEKNLRWVKEESQKR